MKRGDARIALALTLQLRFSREQSAMSSPSASIRSCMVRGINSRLCGPGLNLDRVSGKLIHKPTSTRQKRKNVTKGVLFPPVRSVEEREDWTDPSFNH